MLERVANAVIPTNAAVVFDSVVSVSGDQISYSTATGEISFNAAGYYYIDWFAAPQFGQTTDGSNFALVSSGGAPALTGSSHVRVSQTAGFAIVEVTVPGKTVQLINTSDNSLTLSRFVTAKAALAVFSIASSEEPTE